MCDDGPFHSEISRTRPASDGVVFTAKRTRLVFTFLSEILRVFEELNDIVFQCVGNRDFDWSEICCCHDNFITCHEKSAAVTNLRLSRSKIRLLFYFS